MKLWHSVETPSVFKEFALEEYASNDKPFDRNLRNQLSDLADRHGTHIQVTEYRRG